MNKAILYYTDNSLDTKIANYCRDRLKESGLPIVSVSWYPIDFGDYRAVIGEQKRSYHTLFAQIYIALAQVPEAETVFTCEHDVIYSKEYFNFEAEKDKFYYLYNKVYLHEDGLYTKYGETISMMSCKHSVLKNHLLIRLKGFAQNKRKGGFRCTEPGMRGDETGEKEKRPKISVQCIDIRHNTNFTEVPEHRKGNLVSSIGNYPSFDELWKEINGTSK